MESLLSADEAKPEILRRAKRIAPTGSSTESSQDSSSGFFSRTSRLTSIASIKCIEGSESTEFASTLLWSKLIPP
jgi:hypothetical protein